MFINKRASFVEAFSLLENVGDSDFDFGAGDFNFIVEDGIGIANAGEHVGNRISHSHREPISSFQKMGLPTGFGDAGNCAGVGLITEADTAHLELAEIAVRTAADFAAIVLASGELGFF